MQQLQAAVALHNQGELDQAEVIYRGVLAVDANNFYALRFLGCLCRIKGSFDEGISLLRKAVDQRPNDKDALYNLANLYMDSWNHSKAVEFFERCLAIDDEFAEALTGMGWSLLEIGRVNDSCVALNNAVRINPRLFQAWMNLGNTFKEMGDMSGSISSYRKAIEVKPDFSDAYLNLGQVLHEEGGIEEAIASYRKAIEVKPDFAEAYLNLGNVLKEEGEIDAAADAFSEHHRLEPIAQSFSFASAVASQSLNTESVVKVPEVAEFIPSYILDSIPFGMHLMYVHIPKAGGIRFSSPLFSCIQELLLKGGWQKHPELAASAFGRERVSAMASDRIHSAPMRDGIVAAFSSYDLPLLDFSFLTPHGVSSCELFQGMRDQFDVQPIRLATWRDPRKRLKSALDYLYRTSEGDLGLVREKIDQKDPFLDNAIYRGCFSDFSSQVSPDERRDVQVDYLIDIGDFSVMNQVMSSFLSRCRLPNVIVNKKVNVTSADKKMDAEIADSLMGQCVDSGFISLDGASEVEQMVSKGLPAEFDLKVDPASASLHPLTFVVNAVTDVKTSGSTYLLPTDYLVTDEGQEFLRKTFA